MTASPGVPNAEKGTVHMIDKYRIAVTIPTGSAPTLTSVTQWTTYLGLPRKQMPKLALEYVDTLSKATTDQLCTCSWSETEIRGKMQLKRVDEDLMCPQHSRVGFLLGFFEWAFRNEDDTLSKWRVISGEDDEHPSTIDS